MLLKWKRWLRTMIKLTKSILSALSLMYMNYIKKAGDASDYYNDEYKKLVDIYTNRLDTLEGNYSINSEKYDSFDKMRTLLYRQ